MKRLFLPALALLLLGTEMAVAQEVETLASFEVWAPQVANQAPVATYAMAVSALRYEPAVDIQARNLAEGQADLTVRGSTFANTGLVLGAVTILDPQTGHYFAELPVSATMLGAPEVRTGVSNALGATNVNAASIRYGWRPVERRGFLAVGFGENGLNRQEIYQGVTRALENAVLAADVSYARSQSDGPVPYGDHHFERVAGRLQWRTSESQTDLFAGYQAKFFGWPNLYTPYGFYETENLQLLLFSLNHRRERPEGGYLEAGIYHRRNKDDYEFNRLVPGLYNPYQHTTWLTGAAVAGREVRGDWALRYRVETAFDRLESTSLTHGRYHARQISKLALAGERSWSARENGRWRALFGVAFEDTNKDSGAWSPLAEIRREFDGGVWQALSLGYAESTQMPGYTALNSAPHSGLFRGNADLGRETSRALELRGDWSWGGWSVRTTLFHRRDKDLVDWTYQTGVTARKANAVDISTEGVELIARRDFAHGSCVLGYALLNKDPDYRSASVDASFYALNYAQQRLTAALTWRFTQALELRWDNELRKQQPNALRVVGGDEAWLSAVSLAWRPPMVPGLELAVQIDNLWDSDYQDVPSVPAAPRRMAFSAAYSW